ncbi:hypothetical protein TJA_03840 [Thermus sp. LT1-2-5]
MLTRHLGKGFKQRLGRLLRIQAAHKAHYHIVLLHPPSAAHLLPNPRLRFVKANTVQDYPHLGPWVPQPKSFLRILVRHRNQPVREQG